MRIRTVVLGLVPLALVVALSGCGLTERGNVVREVVIQKGAEVAAQGLDNAERYMCRIAPIGSVKDRYGRSPEASLAYNTLCDSAAGGSSLVGPGTDSLAE